MKSSNRFIQRYLKKLSGWVLLLLALFIGALFMFVYIIDEVVLEKEEAVDHYVFELVATHLTTPVLTGIMEVVTYFASSQFLQIAYGMTVLFYLVQKNWKRAVEIGVIGLGGFAINYSMKLFFQRSRPPQPLIEPLQNFSFPSGHATSGFIFYGLLIYLTWKATIPRPYKYFISSLLLLLALLIGFSRVYLRVHYPTDVVAGFCIGLIWLVLCIGLMERLKEKSDEETKKAAS